MTDDHADAAVVHGGRLVLVVEGWLEDAGGEEDLVPGRRVEGVDDGGSTDPPVGRRR